MANKIYFVRHADSHRADGKRHDELTPLNESGEDQAHRVAKHLKGLNTNKELNINFDGLACSPSLRTKQTAKYIANEVPVFIEYFPLLRELKRSVNGLPYDGEVNSQYSKLRREAMENYNIDWRFSSNDESQREHFARGIQATNQLVELYPDQTIIVVGHSQTTLMMICYMIYGPKATAKQIIDSYKYFFLKNTGIAILEKKYAKPWQLLRFNITDHLK